jgi:hypothetical protein
LGILRRGNANCHACSVLVVSLDFDGLLRVVYCRDFAPCSRSWGSLRFRPDRHRHSLSRTGGNPTDQAARRRGSSPTAQHPSKLFPQLKRFPECRGQASAPGTTPTRASPGGRTGVADATEVTTTRDPRARLPQLWSFQIVTLPSLARKSLREKWPPTPQPQGFAPELSPL